MQRIKHTFVEALNPINKIAHSILKKLNYIETHIIIDSKNPEEIKTYLMDTCEYHSNAFAELPEDKQNEVIVKVWERIHKIVHNDTQVTENKEDLQKAIYDFLAMNGGIMYPLEDAAKEIVDIVNAKK